MSEINLFFEVLSSRMTKENNLSDITYALCESNPKFKRAFLKFFFPGFSKLDKEDVLRIGMLRERWMGGSRPDFFINKEGELYLIEAKIFDHNHHPEYRQVLNNEIGKDAYDNKIDSHIGYIAAYELKNEPALRGCDFIKKQWEAFYEYIKKDCADINTDEVVIGYLKYLENVCAISNYEHLDESLNLKDLKAICELDKAIETIVKDPKEANICYYPSARETQKLFRFGRFFEVKKYEGESSVWGWFGCYYANKSQTPEIIIEFENRAGWGKLVCDKFKNANLAGSDCSVRYDEYDKKLYFWYTGDSEFNLNEPEGQLREFFKNVLSYIKEDAVIKERMSKIKRSKIPIIYTAFHRIPYEIQRTFFFAEAEDGLTIEANPSAWDQWPQCRFGVSFTAKWAKTNTSLDGWVGITMSILKEDNTWDNNVGPRFEVVLFNVGQDTEARLDPKRGWKKYDSKEISGPVYHNVLCAEGEVDLKTLETIKGEFNEMIKEIQKGS